MGAKIVNFRMIRGDTKRWGINISGLGSNTIDALYFSVRKHYSDSKYIFQKQLGDGIEPDPESENPRYIVTILPEDTERLPALDDYVYDIEITVNGDVITPIYGKITVMADVTRHLGEGNT